MKLTGIPYSAPMVRARRDGLKTQTRRMVKDQPRWGHPMPCHSETPEGWQGPLDYSLWAHEGDRDDGDMRRCPYGVPGDRLYVKEHYRLPKEFDNWTPAVAASMDHVADIWFEADGPAPAGFGRFRHGRFMPRAYSRGIDELIAVRVERLQDITEDDAIAEGIDGPLCAKFTTRAPSREHCLPAAVHAYFGLLESLHGEGTWAANPWLWVLTFKVLK